MQASIELNRTPAVQYLLRIGDTCLVLAANEQVAAGLLIQRLPLQGHGNLDPGGVLRADEDHIGQNEDYTRIAILGASLRREELLTLDAPTILHRLFCVRTTIDKWLFPNAVKRVRFNV